MARGDKNSRLRKFIVLVFLLVIILVVILGVILGATLVVNSSQPKDTEVDLHNDTDNGGRLPKWAAPSSYAITLRPNLQTFALPGSVEIRFQAS